MDARLAGNLLLPFTSLNAECTFSLLLRRVPCRFLADTLLPTLTEVAGQEIEDIAEINVTAGRKEQPPISLTLVTLWLFGFRLVKDLQLSCSDNELQVCIADDNAFYHSLPVLHHIPKKSIYSLINDLSKQISNRVHCRIRDHTSKCKNKTTVNCTEMKDKATTWWTSLPR